MILSSRGAGASHDGSQPPVSLIFGPVRRPPDLRNRVPVPYVNEGRLGGAPAAAVTENEEPRISTATARPSGWARHARQIQNLGLPLPSAPPGILSPQQTWEHLVDGAPVQWESAVTPGCDPRVESTGGWPTGGDGSVNPRILYGFLSFTDYLRDLAWHGRRIRRAQQVHARRPTAANWARVLQARSDLEIAETWWADEATWAQNLDEDL